jgi:tetratricopeptide (TPR) repeat protein
MMNEKTLRIFVSSTFNDMTKERDVLVGKVFPMIADYCHKRKAEFIGVDLRWGVTEEQSQAGETVDICMKEIDRCRPLFMGMIGERYGWIPDGAEISVTEQEILYGALEASEETEAFFYLRDKTLTEKLYGHFPEDPHQGALKDTIRNSRYPVMDGYKDLESFADQVYRDLCGAVDRLLTKTEEMDPIRQVREDQLFQASRYSAGYIERPDKKAALEDMMNNKGLVLLLGEEGAGKTAMLSKWVTDHLSDEEHYQFVYFVGNAAEKGWEQIAGQLIGELKTAFSLDYPVPDTKEDLRRAAFILLGMAAKIHPVTLVLDQLDAVSLEDGYGLSWLPEDLPDEVCVLVTAKEGEVLKRLQLREHHELYLNQLDEKEVSAIAAEYLSSYSKSLSPRQLNLLENSENARKPLYLVTLLEEMRHVGKFEWLDKQLKEYLSCRNSYELFLKVLERLDKDYTGDGQPSLKRLFTLLLSSRNGLSEAELIDMMGNIPQAWFAPVMLELERFTAVASGAVHLAVPGFTKAVRKHYKVTDDKIHEIRAELIKWYQKHPESPRCSYEYPWLLDQEEKNDLLLRWICDPSCFLEIWNRSRHETKAYWVSLISKGCSLQEGYQKVLLSPQNFDANLLFHLSELFAEVGETQDAVNLLSYLTDQNPAADPAVAQNASGLLGNLYHREGKLADASRYYQQKYAISRRIGDRYEQQRAIGNIGLVALMRGDLPTAQKAFESVLALARSLNQRDGIQIALGNLGNIAVSMDDLEKAESLYVSQKKISTDSGNLAGLINASGALGILYLKKKDYSRAEKEFLEQESYSSRIGAADGKVNALGNLALLAEQKGDLVKAEALLNEKLELCRKTDQFLGEQSALAGLSALAYRQNDLEKAYDFAKSRCDITKQHRAFRQYAQALMQFSKIEKVKGEPENSKIHELQAKTIARQHGFIIT